MVDVQDSKGRLYGRVQVQVASLADSLVWFSLFLIMTMGLKSIQLHRRVFILVNAGREAAVVDNIQ